MLTACLFGVALAADLVTTRMALLRGIRERNPILRVADPILLMVILSSLVVAPAEVCRASGLTGWTDGLYLGGVIPHLVAAIVNAVAISKRR